MEKLFGLLKMTFLTRVSFEMFFWLIRELLLGFKSISVVVLAFNLTQVDVYGDGLSL